MFTAAQRARHERWLLEVTALPTASGHEDDVVHFIRRWVAARRDLELSADPVGNLFIRQRRPAPGPPIMLTAHLDHPAFVVRQMLADGSVELEFRGGVHDPYFTGAALEIIGKRGKRHAATIVTLDSTAKPFKRVTAELADGPAPVAAGDIGRWIFPGHPEVPVITGGLLHAPACDDLAAVAAALSALDVLRRGAGGGSAGVLFTLAEEAGFLGAIAACKARSIPRDARLICLENSRSFAESPIGAGPIVRVGDKLSVFTPDLTNAVAHLAAEHQKEHPQFRFQRRLMPGGTCEATAFAAYGYRSTCICLPLGNYHNMADIDGVMAGKRPALVAPEFISIDDYHGMIELLVVCAEQLDSAKAPPLRRRMEMIYAEFGPAVLDVAKGPRSSRPRLGRAGGRRLRE